MLETVINVILIVVAVPLAVAFVQFEWWCWSQVARGLHRLPTDITVGMPTWLPQRLVAQLTTEPATAPTPQSESLPLPPEMLALPPASTEDV